MTKTAYPLAGSPILNSQQWSAMARNWLGTGVIKGELNELQVYAKSDGMKVYVKSGKSNIQGHLFKSDAEETIAIGSASATNPRIDRIIVRMDWLADTLDFTVLQGVPAATPSAPALTQNDSKWEISLAQVYVSTNAATIVSANVTDERDLIGLLAPTPFVYVKGGLWGGISSSSTLIQVPCVFVGSPVQFSMAVGFKNSGFDLISQYAGNYRISLRSYFSGLNDLATAESLIRIVRASDGSYADDSAGVYGYSGLGNNYNPPLGIEVRNEIIRDIRVGDKIQFFARCSEAPRNVNQYYIIVEKVSN